MRNKDKTKKVTSPTFFSVLLHFFITNSFLPSLCGLGEWGWQAVHHSCSWLLPSHKFFLLQHMTPSMGQSLTNCFRMGPSHGIESFRNRLQQQGSSTEHTSYQEPAPAGFPQAAGQFLLHFLTLSHSCCTTFFTLSYIYCHRGATSTTAGLSSGQHWGCQSQLSVAVSSMGQALVLSQRGHSSSTSCYQKLGTCTQFKILNQSHEKMGGYLG